MPSSGIVAMRDSLMRGHGRVATKPLEPATGQQRGGGDQLTSPKSSVCTWSGQGGLDSRVHPLRVASPKRSCDCHERRAACSPRAAAASPSSSLDTRIMQALEAAGRPLPLPEVRGICRVCNATLHEQLTTMTYNRWVSSSTTHSAVASTTLPAVSSLLAPIAPIAPPRRIRGRDRSAYTSSPILLTFSSATPSTAPPERKWTVVISSRFALCQRPIGPVGARLPSLHAIQST
jgi:hypothetical protein